MYNTLQEIKEQLFDAPVEVKEAFNTVVGYFDEDKYCIAVDKLGSLKVVKLNYAKGMSYKVVKEFKSNDDAWDYLDDNKKKLEEIATKISNYKKIKVRYNTDSYGAGQWKTTTLSVPSNLSGNSLYDYIAKELNLPKFGRSLQIED